jgi:FixJ family two-component response regulator
MAGIPGTLSRANVQLPIIFVSGHADISMSVRAMKAGGVEFLTKTSDLLGAIQVAIRAAHSSASWLRRPLQYR